MGKPISGQDQFPYTIGGFCVTAANINGELKYNLNIFKQRSSVVYDLIDTNFNVFSFISITYTDTDGVMLNPKDTAQNLAAKIQK